MPRNFAETCHEKCQRGYIAFPIIQKPRPNGVLSDGALSARTSMRPRENTLNCDGGCSHVEEGEQRENHGVLSAVALLQGRGADLDAAFASSSRVSCKTVGGWRDETLCRERRAACATAALKTRLDSVAEAENRAMQDESEASAREQTHFRGARAVMRWTWKAV
eukprot:2818890-Pleurochrysis_carterae.AAC.1